MEQSTEFRDCDKCKTTGRVYDTEKLNGSYCPECDGAGVLHPSLYYPSFVCPICKSGRNEEMAPSHRGSERCESGSLASGGRRSHCTCDTCF